MNFANPRRGLRRALLGAALSAPALSAHAQMDQSMPGMEMSGTDAPAAAPAKPQAGQAASMPGMDMPMTMTMSGAFGGYGMSREASGTSWQPDASPDDGIHFAFDDWMLMVGGYADAVYDQQGGRRGEDKTFSPSMGMLMAQRKLGPGTLGLRLMMSLEPLMGSNGYPLLFATGETADGRTPLVDRQHPHDLFMELSASYSVRVGPASSAFVYFGLPGEPALGPPAFMHRASGIDIPEAPITHHWLDSTHITYGVLTGGYVWGGWKLDASVFRGREPNQERFDIEAPQLDSVSTRLTWNPSREWSAQVSWGYLTSPEQLSPDVNENRVTASATWDHGWGRGNNVAATFAWGRKIESVGPSLNGFLLEGEVVLGELNTLFARGERVDEDELFDDVPGSPLQGRVFTVDKLSVGYIRDVRVGPHVRLGVGGLVSRYAYPAALDAAYGSDPTSFMVFLRVKLV